MNQTLFFKNRIAVRSRASMVGPKEGKGPLAEYFDVIMPDDLLGKPSWEQAESEMVRRTVLMCAEKGGLPAESISVVLAGDLLNQLMSSGFAARELGTPFFGLYGACSTFVEGLVLGSVLIDGGYRENAVCAASSHFCTAERQFRFPLELGTQRPPAAQWTATAAGAMLLDARKENAPAYVTHGTIGRVIDYQITDASHMGAAMAPAVADTIMAHFQDTKRDFRDYDLIATGDLGWIGRNLLKELLIQRGVKVDDEKLFDCGANLFYQEQDPHAGGSGCGCVASVTCGYLMKLMEQRDVRRLLVVGSGAMLSTTSQQQGESIPGIAYAACLEGE
ncbi:MAG: stage V sporulation protein AD [Clostridia bacterium]|nr:stage V sporulation protein AD [Clostridia bacterium]